MTKDELMKRLIKVDGKPIITKPPPRDSLRRDFNEVELSSDGDANDFESFFDFEKDISELESARNQIEKIEKLMTTNHSESEVDKKSFTFLDEDDSVKSGNDDSCFIFEEESDTTINDSNIEQSIETLEPAIQADLDQSKEKVEDFVQENIIEIKNSKQELDELKVSFKTCKYIKNDGENCKRQAPKDSEYCSSHRKVLAKEVR